MHARNAIFVGFNNTSSVIYICLNYATCGGVLHGIQKKQTLTKNGGSFNVGSQTNGPILIGDLTHPCKCGPRTFSSLTYPHLFLFLRGMANVPRSEFTRLAHTYFLPGGADSYKYTDLGRSLTWRCLGCRIGMLTLRRNTNPTPQPTKFQPYGTITHAQPCPPGCPTHHNTTLKCFWFPRSCQLPPLRHHQRRLPPIAWLPKAMDHPR